MAARSSLVPASASYVPASAPYAQAPSSYDPAREPYGPASGTYRVSSSGPSSVVPASVPPTSTQDPRLFMKGFVVHVEGTEPVGPVSADQVARAIKAGKIPAHASIQWQGDLWWKGVYDEPAVIAALKTL